MIKPGQYQKNHLEQMFLDYETIHKTSYKFPKLKSRPVKILHEPKVEKTETHQYVPTDYFTLRKFKQSVPFELFNYPKGVVTCNPILDVPKPINREEFDEGKENAIRTRPRLVMTPAFSLDDIEDQAVRRTIIADTYSTWSRESQKAMQPVHHIEAPLPDWPTRPNPIFLPPLRPPFVPPEWRMETVSWGQKQLRSFVNPEKEFWSKVDVYKSCGPCQQTAQLAQLKKMARK